MARLGEQIRDAERAGQSDPSNQPTKEAPARPYGSIWDRFEKQVLLGAATLMFLLATSIMLYEAFSRTALQHSYFWAEEAVRYLVLWAFFLTLGAAGSQGYHIRTELVVAALGPRGQSVMAALSTLIGLGFSLILFIGALPQVKRYYTMGMLSESNLELPMWALFMAMPLGASLFAIYYFRVLYRVLTGRNPFAVGVETGVTDKF